MNTKKCLPTVIPVVDNSSETCGPCGFTNFTCVKIGKAIPYLNISVNDTLEQVIDKFLVDYKKKVKRISDLETSLAALTLRVEALEP
jgi:hypothetical protein